MNVNEPAPPHRWEDPPPDGAALVYCEGAFGTTNGKTAHGLVRRTTRYRVLGVIDSRHTGRDAAEVLDGEARGIPIYADLPGALQALFARGERATHFVVGLAPDGGRLDPRARGDVIEAIERGLHVDCGLHDILADDAEIAGLAADRGVRLRDLRRLPPRAEMHFFTGEIEQVRSLKVAVLGTDSAVGKRTTAWILVDGLRRRGVTAELIGTGQTAWMQGARHSIVIDALINDFVSGEIEHAVVSCYRESRPDVIVIEGQGSLMNPAYPGGFEILAAGRPDAVVLQHVPGRRDYDGFPGYPIQPLQTQIDAVQLISGKPVVAVTINPESLPRADVPAICAEIAQEMGLPVCEPLTQPVDPVLEPLLAQLDLGRAKRAAP